MWITRGYYSTKKQRIKDKALDVGFLTAMAVFAGVAMACAAIIIFGWPGGGAA